ncbi:MerR family DNA-binding transcriptional regulator [Dictyobacter aurantiacus]|uniref:MerR family transcriptional regulator n=1 Tax=Dictyobacter aurantiacus TaxID=1936993 RepID=A0A401ZK77_9CHLR|nr:MerR family DNA-binding transcriptional regulator [Dictyobacter aurantiacus]GCE07249.1 MerR family transcriptional regulator [Dictyobacter aurantiacus]
MEELSIGEVARRAGIRTSALRYYESIGLLPASRRVSGGHRRYDPGILDLLGILQMARQAGFTIAEMHVLVTGFSSETPASERWSRLAQQKLLEVEEMIARAQENKRLLERLLQCRCSHLEECLQAARDENSSHRTLVDKKDRQ